MINYRKYSGILVCEFMLFFDMVLVFYFTPLASRRHWDESSQQEMLAGESLGY